MRAPFRFIQTLLAAGLFSLCAAQAADGPPNGKPPGPPPEAAAACAGKTAGATASFTGRRGETMTGTCVLVDGVLAVRPAGGPSGAGGPRPAN